MKIFQGLYTCFAIMGSSSSALRGAKFLQHKKHLVRYYSTNDDYITSGTKNIELLSSTQELSPVIDKSLVSRLINKQFPKFKDYPISPILPGGWDNRVFRLGEDMLIRMPSAKKYEVQVEKEYKWLPKLSPLLPLRIPEPIEIGHEDEIYPWKWSIYKWIDGEIAAKAKVTSLPEFSRQLANFLNTLQKIDSDGAPSPGIHNFYRGAPLSYYDKEVRLAIEALKDKMDGLVITKIWEESASTIWNTKPVWLHGDVSAGNLLVNKGKLSAVIDFGMLGSGDPACDLAIAWTFFDKETRKEFHSFLQTNEDVWIRGRGWGLWKALIVSAELTNTNVIEKANSWRVLKEIVGDYLEEHGNQHLQSEIIGESFHDNHE